MDAHEQIYELTGYEPQVILAQMQWSDLNLKNPDLCKVAAKEWGRKPKSLAFCWRRFQEDIHGADRHQLQSLILIAGQKPVDRLELYEGWKDYTWSYERVVEEVAKRKPPKRERKPKTCPHCGEIL